MNIDSLVVEVTRKCNMQCGHCLRGKAENVCMSRQVIEAITRKVRYTNTLTVTGGEPSLAVNVINDFLDCARWNNFSYNSFYMVTNGKTIRQPFLDVITRLFVEQEDGEVSRVSLSNDEYHREFLTSDRGRQRLEELIEELELRGLVTWEGNRLNARNASSGGYTDSRQIIAVGNAKNFGGKELEFATLSVDEEYNDYVSEGEIYINCFGEVFPCCDMSYEMQRDGLHKLGNILDQDFDLIKAIKKYNKSLSNVHDSVNA